MAFPLQKMLLIALILSIAIPISIGHRENSQNESDSGDDSEPESDDDGYYSDPGIDVGGDDSEIGRYLRDLCSDTKKSNQCWKIIKPEINRFTDTDINNVAGIVIDLAREKSNEIKEKLNQLHQESRDDALKDKYISCSRNYNDASHDLETAKGNLDSDDYQRIQDRVKDVAKELKSCKHQFGKKSYDPAHIWDRNKEFGRYVEIVKTATKRFVKERDSNRARKN